MKLVVVESPSKVKPIQKYISSIDKDFVVAASGGHIRRLANTGKGGYGVDIDNEFEPKFVLEASKSKFVTNLKKLAKDADELYLATDPDREGEAIAFHILKVLKFDADKTKRVTYNQITQQAVIDAFNSPKELNQHLIESQFTRQILDKIMGFSLSKVIQKKIKSQSAGRVQSIALKIVAIREQEIKNFNPIQFYDLFSNLKKDDNDVSAKLTLMNSKKYDPNNNNAIFSDQECQDAIDTINKNKLEVIDFKVSEQASIPKAPFQTSTLQQAASSILGFSPRKTMQVAQKLYEGKQINGNHIGLITYMRTDSNIISKSAQETIKNFIRNNFSNDLVASKVLYKTKKSANSQEAHEGIRPTSVTLKPNDIKSTLNNDEYKLYKLIWSRTVSAFMKAAIYKTKSVSLKSDKFVFKATGRELKSWGYLKVWSEYTNTQDQFLPDFKNGEIINDFEIISKANETKPPQRYSEASLIKKMEELGIGRPSTYAGILETLKLRNYIEINKRAINATDRGIQTNDVLQEFFKDLINEHYTANMEKYLDDIASGKIVWNAKLNEFYYKELLPLVENAMENAQKVEDEKVGRACPQCGLDLVYKYNRQGVKFIGCSNFPKCKHLESITMDVKCPKCEEGNIVKLKTKRGKDFYVCSKKECKQISWNVPTFKKCEKCESFLTTPKENILVCENRECESYNKKIVQENTK